MKKIEKIKAFLTCEAMSNEREKKTQAFLKKEEKDLGIVILLSIPKAETEKYYYDKDDGTITRFNHCPIFSIFLRVPWHFFTSISVCR